MVYITLDELKEILPDILDSWIGDDDGNWEWIFQEIEQKCHVGKKKKNKKKQKKNVEDVISILKSDICDLNDFHLELNKKVDELSYKVDGLDGSYSVTASKINRMEQDITAAKSMAQTAKQRTEVDYTKCSNEKSDADAVREIYDRLAGRGATVEELENFRNLIEKYDAWEKKEIPVVEKMCVTCKYNGSFSPCDECNHNNKWEAKNNG